MNAVVFGGNFMLQGARTHVNYLSEYQPPSCPGMPAQWALLGSSLFCFVQQHQQADFRETVVSLLSFKIGQGTARGILKENVWLKKVIYLVVWDRWQDWIIFFSGIWNISGIFHVIKGTGNPTILYHCWGAEKDHSYSFCCVPLENHDAGAMAMNLECFFKDLVQKWNPWNDM